MGWAILVTSARLGVHCGEAMQANPTCLHLQFTSFWNSHDISRNTLEFHYAQSISSRVRVYRMRMVMVLTCATEYGRQNIALHTRHL
jgi:hypothetical protein